MGPVGVLVTLALLALPMPACRGLATGPTGGGAVSGGTSSQALVGSWRRTLVIQTSDDIISSETTWLFAPDGSCERIVASTTVSAGFTETQRSPCTWTATATTVTIRYTGTSGSVTFSWSVQGDTLVLDGVAFTRI